VIVGAVKLLKILSVDTGKGNKHRTVTVSHAMLKAVRRYRRSSDLSELPMPNEAYRYCPNYAEKVL